MAALILPSRRVVQPRQGYTLNQTSIKETGTFFLTFPDKTLRDAVSGLSLANPGGLSFGAKGQTATFNGSQQGNLLLPIPNGHTNLIVAARIRETQAQVDVLGAAFGVYQSTANGGFGVGFDVAGNVGLAIRTNSGSFLTARSPGVMDRWYTVYAQISGVGNGVGVAYVDGRPATTGQGGAYNGSPATPNEIAVGAQHRSSGYLRQFRGDIEWASLMYIPGETWQSLTDDVALRLYESGYPYNLITPTQRRIIVDLGAGGTGATASATPAAVTTTAPIVTATGSASASATPAQATATAATATAAGSANAQATPADASAIPATGTATGAALASSAPASVQITPATATASGESGASVEATATPAPITIAAATATATGSALAQATPAQVTTTALTATAASGISASATLAAIGLMPATGAATGWSIASAIPAQIIVSPAQATAAGSAWAFSAQAQISVTPATGSASEYIKPLYSEDPSAQFVSYPVADHSVDYPLRLMAVNYPFDSNKVDFPLRVLRVNYPKQ